MVFFEEDSDFFFKNPVHVSDPELSIRIQTH